MTFIEKQPLSDIYFMKTICEIVGELNYPSFKGCRWGHQVYCRQCEKLVNNSVITLMGVAVFDNVCSARKLRKTNHCTHNLSALF